jgi:hypothetical protein
MECLLNLYTANPMDITNVLGLSLLYQSLETPLGILCVCVPTFAPLWAKVSSSSFGSWTKRYFSRASASSSASGTGASKGWKNSNHTGGNNSTNDRNFSSRNNFVRLQQRNGAQDSFRSLQEDDEIPLAEVKAEVDYSHMSPHPNGSRNIQVSTDWRVERV